jgi:cytochrome c553
MKKIFLVVATLSLLFIGCEDKQENKTKPKILQTKNSQPSIEIVQNKNSKKIKVEEKIAPKNQDKSYYLNYDIKSNYNPNAQPANSDAFVREKPRTAIDANIHIRSPYEKIKISLIVSRLSKKFIVKCSACHNDYANGIIGPSLLDKTSKQILKSIVDFKTGVKKNPLMNDLINLMSDDEIKQIADEIYNFNQKIKKIGIKK